MCGEECAVPAPCLAPRRDGGPDPRLGPDSRGDDGGGGGLSRRPVLPAFYRGSLADHRVHGRDYSVHRSDDRPGPDRLQEGARLFDRQSARVHDARPRGRRMGRGPLPPLDACLLQSALVPRGRKRSPRGTHL